MDISVIPRRRLPMLWNATRASSSPRVLHIRVVTGPPLGFYTRLTKFELSIGGEFFKFFFLDVGHSAAIGLVGTSCRCELEACPLPKPIPPPSS